MTTRLNPIKAADQVRIRELADDALTHFFQTGDRALFLTGLPSGQTVYVKVAILEEGDYDDLK